MSESADFVAQMDQAMCAAADVARFVHAYYRALIDLGIPADDALALTIDYQAHILANMADEDDE